MNILWVEDKSDETLFNEGVNILEQDPDADYILSELTDLKCQVVRPINWNAAIKAIEDAKIEYDLFILDLNLEHYFDESGDSDLQSVLSDYHYDTESQFKKIAGFHVFIKLITTGVSQNRIAFRTGNMDLLGPLVEGFKKSHLSIPATFDKGSQKVELKSWLKNKFNNDGIDTNYTILRRGILEGIKFWKEEVEEFVKANGEEKFKTEFCLFNNGFRDTKKSSIYIISYLRKLSQLLPQNVNSELKPEIFGLFIKELSSEWEDIFNINNPYFETKNEIVNICNRIMKILRNFTSHMLIGDQLNEQDVAYLFILGMRAILKSSLNKIRYEEMLEKLFTIKEIATNDTGLLKKEFEKIIQKFDNFKINNAIKKVDIFNNYWSIFYSQDVLKDNTKKAIGMKAFYNFFWQELFSVKYELTNKPYFKTSTKSCKLELDFVYSNFTTQEYDKSEFSEFIKSITYTKAFE